MKRKDLAVGLLGLFLVLLLSTAALAQTSTGNIQGTVSDNTGAVVPNAKVTATNTATGVAQAAQTDSTGSYQFPALPPGTYSVAVQAPGMALQRVPDLVVAVNRTSVQNFKLQVGNVSQEITVSAEAPIIESLTQTVGEVIEQRTVQEIPLNGRHFLDLGLLVPGSVVPPANGFLTAPLRGQGSFGLNTAGNREDENNIMVNGINLNDMANGQLTFQPSINTVSEFKIDNSTYSADEGRNAGAIVQIATRSGTNRFHGEAFDFLRNDYFDGRNFFNKRLLSSGAPNPMSGFKRNNFGANLGGPIWRNKTFFFFSYEALRQRQGITLSTAVLTPAQAAAAAASTDPTTRKIAALIPAANSGSTFQGSAVAPVNIDQETIDIQHNFSERDRIHGYYAFQKDQRKEPTLQGNSLPGFGDTRSSHRQLFTFNETHTFSSTVVNDFRMGYNRIHIVFAPDNHDDPTAFGFNIGTSGPVGLPQISIGQTGISLGGIPGFPQGRGDTTTAYSDTLNWLRGKHSFKFGGEYRKVFDNGFTNDVGSFRYADVASFVAGNANSFAITLGSRTAHVRQGALAGFAVDSYRVRDWLTIEAGLRWEWNQTPTETNNASILFVPASASLVQLGTNGLSDVYHQNWKNIEPRVGLSWDLFHTGKTVLRVGYGYQVDQPLPLGIIANPPIAVSYSLTSGTTKAATALSSVKAAGLALATVDHNFSNAYIQSYNLNVQQQLTSSMSMMVGYFGSKGTKLRTAVNLNQILDPNTFAPGTTSQAIRTFNFLSPSSPVYPTTPIAGTSSAPCPALPTPCALGNITETLSNGTSNYNAMWLTVSKRLSHGLTLNGNYTWSKSLDETSQNTQGVVVQDSFHLRGDYGPSDFDARHHFTVSAIYELPFKGNRLVQGWRVGTITTLQSGNPLRVVAGSPVATTFTGVGSVRPDLTGNPTIVHQLVSNGVQWFANSVCDPRSAVGSVACPSSSVFTLPIASVGGKNVFHFGNLGRNSILGPSFKNADVSLSKVTPITERVRTEFRAEVFDLFNHPNFGNPALTATALASSTAVPTFGVITGTRNPTGDAGSSRQIQLSLKLLF